MVAVIESLVIGVPLPSTYFTWMVAAAVVVVSLADAAVEATLIVASAVAAVEVSPATI